jgi:hypothetical protein
MAWSRGFGAEETKAAFTRAQELAVGTDNTDERFATYYGLWLSSIARGELRVIAGDRPYPAREPNFQVLAKPSMYLPTPSTPGNRVAPFRPMAFNPCKMSSLALGVIVIARESLLSRKEVIQSQWSKPGLLANVNSPCCATKRGKCACLL